MKEQTIIIECPECGCKEIHREYNLEYGSFLMLPGRTDDDMSAEPGWCYCLCCGVMFDPMQEAAAV